jgi:putative tricarboxylic transport membrane protein
MDMKKINYLCGVLGLIFTAYIFISSAAFPTDKVMKIGPDFFPRLMATGMGIASIALLISTYINGTTMVAEAISFKDPGIRRAIIVFISAIVYVFLMQVIGFILSTIIFMMFMMHKLQLTSYGKMLLVSVLTAALVQLAFQGLLDIQLPMGFFENFL